jgi:hypothetical protein
MTVHSSKSIVLAVALALGGGAALAQKPDKPVNTGQEANSREAVRAEAREAARNTTDTTVPPGEASTMTNHQPNMQLLPISNRSRAEVRQEVMPPAKPRFGDKGERSVVPTNPQGKVATPQ